MRDTAAAKDLLYRRLKALAAFEAANKELDLARSRNRDREVAETHQKEAWAVFEAVKGISFEFLLVQQHYLDVLTTYKIQYKLTIGVPFYRQKKLYSCIFCKKCVFL